LREIGGQDRVGVGGYEDGLVAVAVVAVVDVGGAGRVVAVAATVIVVGRCAVLGIGAVPAWVIHEFAVAKAEASQVVCVVVVDAAAVVIVAGGAWSSGVAAIGGAGVGGACGAMLMAASGLKVSALVFSTMSVPSLSSRTGLPSMLLLGFLWMLQ